MKKSPIFMLLLILPLFSCTFYSLVPENTTLNVSDAYRVKIEAPWNARTLGSAVILTQYGQNLDSLVFFYPAGDGQPPLTVVTEHGKKMPSFKKTMTMVEFPELLKSSLANIGYLDIQIERMEPSVLDEIKALRIDFQMKTEHGPQLKCFAFMGTRKEKLYAILFTAEKSTYFPLVSSNAEKVIASLNLIN
ncbi:MAG: hypothetical protein EPN26_03870 [Rhodospirillales bacterium]|nr:MAG: hypothetical protein EPN26_03870 [Rhodospirillales bacterium]